jgi:toxin CptA
MYNAPAVSYPVGRSRFHGWLLAAVLAAGASSLAVWTMQSDQAGLRHLTALGMWLVTASVAIGAWLRSPAGLLTWDTKTWLWGSDEPARQVNLSVVLDSQGVLLLHLRLSGNHPLWIWPERRTAPARWLALRRAVFAQHPSLSSADADGATP